MGSMADSDKTLKASVDKISNSFKQLANNGPEVKNNVDTIKKSLQELS